MPHAVFELGILTQTTEARSRPIIPGVEPGGSRVGQATKPALLIKDCYLELIDTAPDVSAANFSMMSYFLKLSQELDMTPGLQLPIAQVYWNLIESNSGTAGSAAGLGVVMRDLFRAQGTIWAPRGVGIRAVEVGGMTIDARVHLDYEMVDVPWMDWFIMWELLDGIGDNELEY